MRHIPRSGRRVRRAGIRDLGAIAAAGEDCAVPGAGPVANLACSTPQPAGSCPRARRRAPACAPRATGTGGWRAARGTLPTWRRPGRGRHAHRARAWGACPTERQQKQAARVAGSQPPLRAAAERAAVRWAARLRGPPDLQSYHRTARSQRRRNAPRHQGRPPRAALGPAAGDGVAAGVKRSRRVAAAGRRLACRDTMKSSTAIASRSSSLGEDPAWLPLATAVASASAAGNICGPLKPSRAPSAPRKRCRTLHSLPSAPASAPPCAPSSSNHDALPFERGAGRGQEEHRQEGWHCQGMLEARAAGAQGWRTGGQERGATRPALASPVAPSTPCCPPQTRQRTAAKSAGIEWYGPNRPTFLGEMRHAARAGASRVAACAAGRERQMRSPA